MKKILDSKLFYFMLGAILFSSMTVYAATQYYANEVSFKPSNTEWNATNVEEALNDLYTKVPYSEYTGITTITPTTDTQTLSTKNKVLKNDITINSIPETYKNLTSNTTVNEKNLLKGVTAYDKDGNLITGNISTDCISGTFVGESKYQTNTGDVIADFAPSYFVINVLTVSGEHVLYYNGNKNLFFWAFKNPNNVFFGAGTQEFSARFTVKDNKLYYHNMGNEWIGQTAYYMICK